MYHYVCMGMGFNKLKPILKKHNVKYKFVPNPNIKEIFCSDMECDLTPKEMLPFLREAKMLTRIIPIQTEELRKGNIRAMLMKNMAHLAYISETDTLIVKDETD